MSIHQLHRMFHPKSVAVIGVGEAEESPGRELVRSLAEGGFAGSINPVSAPGIDPPSRVADLPVWPSLEALAASPDLALIALPLSQVPDAVRSCVAAGVGGAAIIASGSRGRPTADAALMTEIRDAAQAGGLRLLGPDCTGLVSTTDHLNASLSARMPPDGRTAFISQSGAIYTAMLDLALREKVGFRYFVSLGRMLDVDFGDVIDFLGNDNRVGSILLYMESLRRVRNFMSAVRSVARVKPIIAMKAGGSPFGRSAAARHCGTTAGDDAVYDAAFQRAGIVRVQTFEELFDCVELLSKKPRPTGDRLAVVTNGGGPGVLAMDAMAAHGLRPALLEPATLAALGERLPAEWSRSNPVDLLADAGPERFRHAAETCLADPGVDGLVVILSPFRGTRPVETAEALLPVFQDRKRPVFAVWMGGLGVAAGRRVFNEAGVPTFDTPERAVRAVADLYRHDRHLEMLREIPPALPDWPVERPRAAGMVATALRRGATCLDEVGGKAVLAAYGIPVPATVVAETPDEAWRLAHDLGFPVVLKVRSPDVDRRSHVGGVALDLQSEFEVYQAFERVVADTRRHLPRARIEGVTVQRMLPRAEVELMMAITRDPGFGPVIRFGAGGGGFDAAADQAVALPPLNRLLARRLMEGTRIFQRLKEGGDRPGTAAERLEELLIRLSQMAIDLPDVASVVVDPLMVTDGNLVAADSRVTLVPSDLRVPFHLAISPYPNRYETHGTAEDGTELFIRPIRPEDAPLLNGLFDTLSEQSVYYRFFGPLKELNPDMLVRFTQIDYDREVALVALPEVDRIRMLGVARVIHEPDGETGEFSVLVGDPWQGRGIGAELLRRCLLIAREQGLRRVWGIVLPANRRMLALARRLGFSVQNNGSGDLLLRLDLTGPLPLAE